VGPLVDDLGEWEEDSVARLGRDRYSTAKQARIVGRFVAEAGIRSLEEIRPRPLTDWLRKIAADGLSSQTRANALAAIRSFVRWAVETERLAANAIENVRIARRERSGPGAEAFTAEEVARLVEVARDDISSPNLRLRRGADARMALYLVLATTGLRHGEIRSQRWRDVDLRARTLTVTHDKARRRDTVPLCDEAVEILRWWRERSVGEDLVFPAMPTHRTLERDMARAGVSSGVGQWHRFRKTAVTLRAEAGVPMWDLTRIARHVDPRTTLRYVTPRDDALRRAASAMPRLLVLVREAGQGHPGKIPSENSRSGPSHTERVAVLPAPSRWAQRMEPGGFDPPT
jgi:integrase